MRRLRTVLVAPSRYDQHGVVVFRLGINQSSTLSALAGLIEDYNRRHADTVEVNYDIFDEHVTEAVRPELLRRWHDAATGRGERFVLMVCGVQTATYARGRDIALMAHGAGLPVIIGGAHLSAHGPSADFLAASGVSVAIGEVEPIWDRIIEDALGECLAPVYRIGTDEGVRVKTSVSDISAPDITHIPYPSMPARYLSQYLNKSHLYIDASRGCPYLCTFCTVKNLFGRTVRSRDPKALVAWIADRYDHDGIRWFPFTDDNFVRNPRHLEVLEGLAHLRASGRRISISLILDIESSCYAEEDSPRGERTRRFLALCRAAGVGNVFMGLESTTDAVLQETRKTVNRDRPTLRQTADADPAAAAEAAHRAIIARYRAGVRAWQAIGTSVECGYILGFASDRRDAGQHAARDLEEIGLDIANFFLLTPLPGSEDYARAVTQGTLLEHDFNGFFCNRTVVAHPTMTPDDVNAELRAAARNFYSSGKVARRLIRGLLGIGRGRVVTPWIFVKRLIGTKMMIVSGMYSYYEGGLLRRRGASTPRPAVTDAEARAYFLGSAEERRESGLPPNVLRDGDMESLPILSRHEIHRAEQADRPRAVAAH